MLDQWLFQTCDYEARVLVQIRPKVMYKQCEAKITRNIDLKAYIWI